MSKQPLLVKIAVGLTFYNSFVLFEELVIDRHGLWRYLPFYKFGNFCAWDFTAIIAIGIVVWWAASRWKGSDTTLQSAKGQD